MLPRSGLDELCCAVEANSEFISGTDVTVAVATVTWPANKLNDCPRRCRWIDFNQYEVSRSRHLVPILLVTSYRSAASTLHVLVLRPVAGCNTMKVANTGSVTNRAIES